MQKLSRALKSIAFIILLLSPFIFFACASSGGIFPAIGNNLSSPINITVDSTTNRAYLINSNNAYNYTTGSFQVYDITTPTAPKLLNTAIMDNFSGDSYYDLAEKFIYTANRFSTDVSVLQDHILRVNIDETSANFLNIDTYSDGQNPFAMAFDAVTGTIYTATSDGYLDYFTLAAPATINSLSLFNLNLSDGNVLPQAQQREITIVGRQAYLTRPDGGVMIFDIDGKKLDYLIWDISSPRGITYDGTYVYVVSVDSSTSNSNLIAINPAAFPILPPTGIVTLTSQTTAGVVAATVQVGIDTLADAQEVTFSTNPSYIFVTNMGDNSLSIINRPALTKTVADITLGTQPFGMGIYTVGSVDQYLYVTNLQSNNISIINLATLAVVAAYP